MASLAEEPAVNNGGVLRRTRSVGTKLTDEEYARLEALTAQRGLSPGEWIREVVLASLDPPAATTSAANPPPQNPPNPPSLSSDPTLLAEILALRTIVTNAVYDMSAGELTDERMREIIARADAGKLEKALERLKEQSAPRKPK
jgi:hypothetical protein